MALECEFRVTARRPFRRARMWLFGFPTAILAGVAAPALAQGDGRDGPLSPPIGHGPRHHGGHGPRHHGDPSGSHRDAVPEHRVYRYDGDGSPELDRGRERHGEDHRPDRPPRDGESREGDSNEESVADRISAILRSGGLGDHTIAVWHEDGEVTLDGRVASEKSKRLAQKLALGVDEVREVVNRLRVDLGETEEADESPREVPTTSGGRVVGDVTVNVEVNVNVNSGNTMGPAGGPPERRNELGPPGRPDGPPRGPDRDPREAGPTRGGDAPEREGKVRELEEQVGRLRGELEAMRRNREAEERARQEAREGQPQEPRGDFDRIRRELERRAEEMRGRFLEGRWREEAGPEQERRRNGERREEGGEGKDEGDRREGDRDEDEDRRERDRDDDRRAEAKSWPFEGIDILPGVEIPKHLMPEVR